MLKISRRTKCVIKTNIYKFPCNALNASYIRVYKITHKMKQEQKPISESLINALADMQDADRCNWIRNAKDSIDFLNTYKRITQMKVRLMGDAARFTALTLVVSALQSFDPNF